LALFHERKLITLVTSGKRMGRKKIVLQIAPFPFFAVANLPETKSQLIAPVAG
jgi:hypothetical protein